MASSSNVCHGHTFLINGALWYTPNSERTIQLPPPLELGKGVNPFSTGMTWESLHQPRRWSHTFGYLCFTPLTRLMLNIPLVHQLAHLPQLEYREGLWSLPDDIIHSWDYFNNTIYEVSMALRTFYPAALLPFTPRAWGYHRHYRSEAKARRIIKNSRDWFLVWLGALSFFIAHARKSSDGSSPSRRPAPRDPSQKLDDLEYNLEDWQAHLYQYQHLQDFAAQLGSSVIIKPQSDVPRAGLVVDLTQPDGPGQPSVLWLLEQNIPVWYPWNEAVARYASQHHLTYLSPPPHLIQNLQTTFFSTPSTSTATQHTATPTAAPVEPEYNSSPLDPANMAARHQEMLKIIQEYEATVAAKRSSPEWTPEDKQRANNRARKPPITSANVYVHEPCLKDPRKLKKVTVSRADKDDTLGEYTDAQCRYFPEINTWVCSDDLTECKVVPFSSDDDDYPEVTLEAPSTSPASTNTSLPPAIAPNLAPPLAVSSFFSTIPHRHLVVANAVPPCYRDHLYKDPQGPQHLWDDLLEFMTIFFGYAPSQPLPSGSASQPFDGRDRSIMLRGLGIHPTTPAASAFGETNLSRDMHSWLRQCLDNDPKDDSTHSPQLHNWDIIHGSPSAVTHPSLQHLRIVPSSQKSALFEFYKFKQYWFLFDDSFEDCGWTLTVTTAAHALAVLRLRQMGRSYYEIALLFLCRGVTFRTFRPLEPSVVWVPSHPIMYHLPNRAAGYRFSLDDYYTYIHHRNMLLGEPRLRAALLRGGILWRIAASSIECEDVLEGPTNSSGSLALMDPTTLQQSIDDSLLPLEEGLLVGAYVCYTGHGPKQVSTKSWWPLPEAFEKGEDFGHWTPFNETWYQERMDEIVHRGGKLLSKADWRAKLRGRAQVRNLRANLETRSHTCLKRLAPGALSHL